MQFHEIYSENPIGHSIMGIFFSLTCGLNFKFVYVTLITRAQFSEFNIVPLEQCVIICVLLATPFIIILLPVLMKKKNQHYCEMCI